MWVLALDTSTPDGSVAVLRDDAVISETAGVAGRSHAERLPAALDEVLAAAGIARSDVDLLAAATGPGAFTGLRVGLATIQGVAMALDRPVAGVSSLAAIGWRHFAAEPAALDVGVWLDAARGDVFAAAFRRPAASSPDWPLVTVAAPIVATPEATIAAWRCLALPAAALVLGPAAGGRDRAVAGGWAVHDGAGPLAAVIGRLASREHRAGRSGPPHALAPEYVRRPDAEVERDRRRGLATPAP